MRSVLPFLMLLACRRELPIEYQPPEEAYSISGTVRIEPPTDRELLRNGQLNIRLYTTTADNYCNTTQIAAEAPGAMLSPDLLRLYGSGQSYSITIYTTPSTQFPLTVYPVAEWQTTKVRQYACEKDSLGGTPHYNARGAYQPVGESVCCGPLASPITIAAQGDALSNIDFVLKVRTPDGLQCEDPDAPYKAPEGACSGL